MRPCKARFAFRWAMLYEWDLVKCQYLCTYIHILSLSHHCIYPSTKGRAAVIWWHQIILRNMQRCVRAHTNTLSQAWNVQLHHSVQTLVKLLYSSSHCSVQHDLAMRLGSYSCWEGHLSEDELGCGRLASQEVHREGRGVSEGHFPSSPAL